MRPTHRRWLLALLPLAAFAATLTLPAAASAQTAAAYVDGAEPWTESGCDGQIPIVVGADAKAQSDIYSAVTLAGVVDTDCVILAGPRDGAMPASQRARLEAADAGGYVVGGTAAVPTAKLAGRDMKRIGGATRWATAQQVGSEAAALAAGTEPETAAAPDTTRAAPADVAAPGLYLSGAEPWIASDCDGQIPIVVGGDAKAQSDIYSAVTLAGVLDTGCVILAGPRDAAMPASQQARLEAADAGGYALGGTAAVPTAKIAGRDMTRLGGATRWATAELVGRRASGDTTAGTRTTTETDNTDTETAGFTAVSAGGSYTCGIRTGGAVECWGWDDFGQASPPSGTFTAISAGGSHSCGVRPSGAVECWGSDDGQLSPPSGTFTAISAGETHSCGVRPSGAVECWGWNREGEASPPWGTTFTAVSAGFSHSCGIRTGGAVECWGSDDDGEASPPSGTFTAVSVAGTFAGSVYSYSCGIRTGGAVECWGWNREGEVSPPSGTFTAVSAGGSHSCGIRTGGAVECWGYNAGGQASPPSGTFIAVSAGAGHSCGIRPSGAVECWGHDAAGESSPPGS